jgi:hypothetical protein
MELRFRYGRETGATAASFFSLVIQMNNRASRQVGDTKASNLNHKQGIDPGVEDGNPQKRRR